MTSPTTTFSSGTVVTSDWLNAVDEYVFNVRSYGAVLDGVTDDLAAFNAAIADSDNKEIIVDGVAYLSAATTNAGKTPIFKFLPGAGITTTPGGAIGGESARLSWPMQYTRKFNNGPEFISTVSPSTTAGSTYGWVRGTYKQFNGNAAVLGTTNGVGDRTNYISYAYGAGSDIADYRISIFRRSTGQDGGYGFGQNLAAISANVGGATTRWGVIASEMNVVNRYADTGFSPVRSSMDNWSGILQLVPEDTTYGEGGTAYNITFALMIGHSNGLKADGFYAKQYAGISIEPQAIAGDGYGAYWSGNDGGVSSQDPKAALALAQTWKTGINTQAATLTTNRALAMGATHRVDWIDGSGNTLNGIYSGNGTPEGTVTAPKGSMYLRRDGGANTTMYVKESGTGNTGWVGK